VALGGTGHRRRLELRGARGRCRHPATRVAVWKDVTTMKFLATEPAAGLLCVALAACAPPSFAQGDPADCVGITDGSARLACYDAAMGRTATSGPAPVADANAKRSAVFARDLPPAVARAAEPVVDVRSEPAEMSLLDRRWELFPES